jgi:hypothetical protein
MIIYVFFCYLLATIHLVCPTINASLSYPHRSLIEKIDLCDGSNCAHMYVISAKSNGASSNLAIKLLTPLPTLSDSIFENVLYAEYGRAKINHVKKLEFDLLVEYGKVDEGGYSINLDGYIEFPNLVTTNILTVLTDNVDNEIWMVSDSEAASSCQSYTGSILFSNTISPGNTFFARSDGQSLDTCLPIKFGAVTAPGTTESQSPNSPVCQNGNVHWSFYSDYKCKELLLQKYIDTSSGNLFCILLGNNSTKGSSFELDLTCLGENTPDLPQSDTSVASNNELADWWGKNKYVFIGTLSGSLVITILFVLLWKRRPSDGDIVMYEIKEEEEIELDVESSDRYDNIPVKSKFSLFNWLNINRKDNTSKKRYGLATVVKGRGTLCLQPLRKVIGYTMANQNAIHSSQTKKLGNSLFGDKFSKNSVEESKLGSSSGSKEPSRWALVEEEDESCVIKIKSGVIYKIFRKIKFGVLLPPRKKYKKKQKLVQKDTLNFYDDIGDSDDHNIRDPSVVDDYSENSRINGISLLRRRNGIANSVSSDEEESEIPLLQKFDDIFNYRDLRCYKKHHTVKHYKCYFLHDNVEWSKIVVPPSTITEELCLFML